MDRRVATVIERMEQGLKRQWTVGQLAAEVELSVAQLTRLFRLATGTTPAAFLHDLRLRRARLLIERTSLPISEVMAEVGIADRSHFARNFRRVHGFGPRDLRVYVRVRGRKCG